MKSKKAAVIISAASFGLFSLSCPAFAANPATPDASALSSLAGADVPSVQLDKLRGGNFVVSSNNIGMDSNNSANYSQTGNITNNQSVNNNTGITTVFQNTGNNTLMQSNTMVNISVH